MSTANERTERSSSLERRVQGYLDPKQFALFSGYMHREELGESGAIREIVKAFFSTLSDDKRREYMEMSRKNKSGEVSGVVSWPV